MAPRYAVLLVPRFRLQAALCLEAVPHPGDSALGLVDGDSSRGMLLEVNAGAQRFGVASGMAASQALARCPQLVLLNASAAAEAEIEKRLLHFVETLSPRVEKQAPDIWLLDFRGALPPEPNEWAHRALERLRASENIEAMLGIAPQPGLALCAARRARPVRVVEEVDAFVDELRFEELAVSPHLRQVLHDWGISNLGDLLRLPRQATLERLGPEASALWEVVRDSRESVLRLENFPEPLELCVEFENPVETVEPVLFTLNRMLEQLCSRLRLLERVAAGMQLRLSLENGATHERRFTIPAPTRTEAVLLRILETHLGTLLFDSALVGARLKIEETKPSAQQLALFENPLRDPNRFGETLARLRALVGEGHVGVPVASETHRPGAFCLADPIEFFAASVGKPAQAPTAMRLGAAPSNLAATLNGVLLGLPLRRFRPSHSAHVRLEAHRPIHVDSGPVCGPVLDSRGPFRLSGNWWDHDAWCTEQWDILLGGRGCGLYRIARSGTSAFAGGAWYLEGCYDAPQWSVQPVNT